MHSRINLALPALVLLLSLAACNSYESEYEKGVYDYEPLYCYQSLGGVDCHREPHHRDAARLVNYYGPGPSKYDPPEPPERSPLQPPPQAKATSTTTPAVASRASSPGDAGDASGKEPSEWEEWKKWLPFVSVAFGALQVAAAFAF